MTRRSVLSAAITLPALATASTRSSRVPVVAELFTSEGCSSCPPADKLLAALHEKQPFDGVEIIALSEHVDYWNRLGWNDPFSRRQFSERQHRYAQHWPGRVYTPQLVIDGRYELVGSDVRRVEKTILRAAEEPKITPGIDVEFAGSSEIRLEVAIPARLERGAADVFIALLEDGLETFVAKGENRGRTLPHTAVARTFEKAGIILKPDGSPAAGTHRVRVEKDWKRENLRVAAFVQLRKSGHVVGAATAAISA